MNDKRPWSEGGCDKPFCVSAWSDTPGETDTCSMGVDFSTEVEARECLAQFSARFPWTKDLPYLLLDGPDVHEVTTRTLQLKRSQREQERDEREARSEQAMQAGMGMGIHAYNDAMGYDSEPYDPAIHDSDYDREPMGSDEGWF